MTDVARDKIGMQKEMDKNERRRLNKLIEQGEHDDRKEKSDLNFN